MNTEYGSGNKPDNEDRRQDTAGTNPTEPIRGAHPTEPIPGAHPTQPIGNTYPTKPIRGSGPQDPAAERKSAAAEGRGVDSAAGSGATAPDSRGTGKKPAIAPARDRRPRVATIVWGLILVALAVLLILGQVTSISLNMGLVVIGLLLGAGLVLVIGGIISAGTREKDDKRA